VAANREKINRKLQTNTKKIKINKTKTKYIQTELIEKRREMKRYRGQLSAKNKWQIDRN